VLGKVTYASEEFIITRKGKPVARIVPYAGPTVDHPRTLAGAEFWQKIEQGILPLLRWIEVDRSVVHEQ
jgi:antitoxin (DNA-binding transcriptional repressor) of toxin-antitoxin stability system